MAANSSHYGDVANWIVKVINSCETYKQLAYSRNLMKLWDDRFWDKLPFAVSHELKIKMREAYDERIQITLNNKQ
jgi:hypothetical protein